MESDTVERYDRQIRLWGQHGQSKCSNSKICLIKANSLGTEILKGLCLAGIGSFTILDSHKLAVEDVGCSFLPPSCIGQSRGECVKKATLDLNEEVSGEVHPLETYLPHFNEKKVDDGAVDETSASDLNFWKQFNCVIASGFLYIDQIVRLSKVCWNANIPLILCKSIGFYSSVRIQAREHLIIETHPDNVLPSFNLDKPFKDLADYFNSIDIESDASLDKVGSYPYIVIVYKYLKKWQTLNNLPSDRLPNSYAEKKELRLLIDDGLKQILRRRAQKKADDDELPIMNQETPFENFLEASKGVNTCLTVSSKLPESVEAIFNHPKLTSASSQNISRFWLITRAIKEFVLQKNNGLLPVAGNIPDMISSSNEYIKLQNIYSKKASEDVDNVFSLVQTAFSASNCSPGSSLHDETKLICKSISDLRMIHTKPIFDDYHLKNCCIREEDEEDQFVTMGLCLGALDLFFTSYSRLPGCQDNQVETDINKLKEHLKQMVGKVSNRLKTLDQCLYELCRYGGAELHATSAFMGGCVVQEVIKLITNQYIPVNDTLIYDAMTATTKAFVFSDSFSTGTSC